MQYLIQSGSAGNIGPVSPSRAEIQGLMVLTGLHSNDQPVDCGILAIDAADTDAALDDLGGIGGKAAVLTTRYEAKTCSTKGAPIEVKPRKVSPAGKGIVAPVAVVPTPSIVQNVTQYDRNR